jgi:hypothetical protein
LKCPDPIVTPEKISIRSILTPVGIISFEGDFLPKQGEYWGMPPQTIVLKGKVIVEKDGETVYSKDHDFTYTTGD